jgi:hypothetical protein
MKKENYKNGKDLLEIFGNFLEFFSCERLKEMNCMKFFCKNEKYELKKKKDARLELYNISLAIT